MYFDQFKNLRVFWSFYRFQEYFGLFRYFENILIVLEVRGYFDHFRYFKVFLFVLEVSA